MIGSSFGDGSFAVPTAAMRRRSSGRVCWRKAGEIEELNCDLVFADDDLLGHVLDDLALRFLIEFRPAGSQILGLGNDLLLGEEADLEEVDLALERWEFGFDLVEAFFEGPVLPAVALH
jgi:hypothetical protein